MNSKVNRTADVLTLRDIGKTYRTFGGEATVAVRDVNLSVQPGEFVSLVGPSGCGKTTLLKICANLLEATSGTLLYKGSTTKVPSADYGMVFQQAALLPWRTVLDNVLLPASILRIKKTRKIKDRANELLELVHLLPAADKYPTELSGGMQQRCSIARSLLHDPEILFMDEPFGALDAMTREELNLSLQNVQLKESKTTLFVTHNIQEAVFLSDRVVVMSSGPGRIVTDVPITLPRPRSLKLQLTDEFRSFEREVRAALDAGGQSSDVPEGSRNDKSGVARSDG